MIWSVNPWINRSCWSNLQRPNTTSMALRGIRLTFVLLVVTSSLTTTILFSTQKRQHEIKNFENSNDGSNSTFQEARSECFTVGFVVPRRKNGLGNYLFYFAGTMYIAWLTGRKPLILSSNSTKLDQAFDLDTPRQVTNKRCLVRHFFHRYIYAYNTHITDLTKVGANVSIEVSSVSTVHCGVQYVRWGVQCVYWGVWLFL